VYVKKLFIQHQLLNNHSLVSVHPVDFGPEDVGSVFVIDGLDTIAVWINQSIFFFYLAAMGRLAIVLFDFSQESFAIVSEGIDQELWSNVLHFAYHIFCRPVKRDRKLCCIDHISRIQSSIHFHDGDTSLFFLMEKDGLDGGSATIFG